MPPTGGGRKEHMSTDVSRVSVQVGREEITLETGKLAKQAGGAVVVSQGETMVLATATAGNIRDVDFLAMNGASAAIQISDIPVQVPVGAVRIGQDEEGNFVVNPEEESLLDPKLDLVVAGTEEAILMVEAGAQEVSEQEILDALDIAHGEIQKLCKAQLELREKVGKPKAEVEVPKVDEDVLRQVQERFCDALNEAT